MRKAVEKILEKIKRDKRIAAIVCVGLAGIILLTLSELMPQGKDVTEKSDKEPVSDIRDSYEDDIEKRLTSIVSAINGAGPRSWSRLPPATRTCTQSRKKATTGQRNVSIS